jgi:hypothetical protein
MRVAAAACGRCCPSLRRQWLFIIEGLPSVLLGVAMWIWLPSHPLWDAWMLTPQQREVVHARVR